MYLPHGIKYHGRASVGWYGEEDYSAVILLDDLASIWLNDCTCHSVQLAVRYITVESDKIQRRFNIIEEFTL